MSYETLTTKDTGYYADTVEWCPVEGFRDFLVCGTYQLIEKDNVVGTGNDSECQDGGQATESKPCMAGRRVGNIQLYQLDKQLKNLNKCSTKAEGGGILDTKWYQKSVNGSAILGAVSAESELKLLMLSSGDDNITDLTEQHATVVGEDKICLSLDWSNHHLQSAPTCVVSDSQGQLTILQCSEASWEARSILQWTAHGYEAWIAAFDRWEPNIVYSGGDDCLFRGWDTRTDCRRPIFTSKKHEMGVSSIQCSPVHDHIMATGSYDETILVWDTRNMKTPLTSANPGGGVWRIKWHPHTGRHILTATMYDGYHVLKYSNENGANGLELVTSYKEGAELAYGADWCQLDVQKCQSKTDGHVNQSVAMETSTDKDVDSAYDLIATCSFYDHTLHLWKIGL